MLQIIFMSIIVVVVVAVVHSTNKHGLLSEPTFKVIDNCMLDKSKKVMIKSNKDMEQTPDYPTQASTPRVPLFILPWFVPRSFPSHHADFRLHSPETSQANPVTPCDSLMQSSNHLATQPSTPDISLPTALYRPSIAYPSPAPLTTPTLFIPAS